MPTVTLKQLPHGSGVILPNLQYHDIGSVLELTLNGQSTIKNNDGESVSFSSQSLLSNGNYTVTLRNGVVSNTVIVSYTQAPTDTPTESPTVSTPSPTETNSTTSTAKVSSHLLKTSQEEYEKITKILDKKPDDNETHVKRSLDSSKCFCLHLSLVGNKIISKMGAGEFTTIDNSHIPINTCKVNLINILRLKVAHPPTTHLIPQRTLSAPASLEEQQQHAANVNKHYPNKTMGQQIYSGYPQPPPQFRNKPYAQGPPEMGFPPPGPYGYPEMYQMGGPMMQQGPPQPPQPTVTPQPRKPLTIVDPSTNKEISTSPPKANASIVPTQSPPSFSLGKSSLRRQKANNAASAPPTNQYSGHPQLIQQQPQLPHPVREKSETPTRNLQKDNMLLDLGVASETEVFSGVISLIFDKAITDSKQVTMYTDWCRMICTSERVGKHSDKEREVARVSAAGGDVSAVENGNVYKPKLRTHLLKTTQEEYEKIIKTLDKVSNDIEPQECEKIFGLIKLIAELFNQDMLADMVIHGILVDMIGEFANPKEIKLECCYKLLSLVGHKMISKKGTDTQEFMCDYYQQMETLVSSPFLSQGIKDRIQKVLDLKNNGWCDMPKDNARDHQKQVPNSEKDGKKMNGNRIGSYTKPQVADPVCDINKLVALSIVDPPPPTITTTSTSTTKECPICFEDLLHIDNISSTQCGHVFCTECIEAWLELEHNKACPKCQGNLDGKTPFHRIYFQ
eukprot:gene13622-16032_t